MAITVEDIVSHAMDVEVEDPIDWGMLSIDEYSTYCMIASSMLDHYNTLDPAHRELMMLSVITKVVVENFVLNLKLHQT